MVLFKPCRALCFINLAPPSPTEIEAAPEKAPSTKKKKKSKRKQEEASIEKGANGSSEDKGKQQLQSSKFRIVPLRDPCLFLGHLGPSSLFVAEKPWAEVLSRFPPPLYRHKYGT